MYVKQEAGRKIERQNRDSGRMAQEHVKPKGRGHLRMTARRMLEVNLSFILTVNLNLDEVQCIPCVCFKTKAKLLSVKLG